MTQNLRAAHPLLLAIRHANEMFSNAVSVLITTITTEDGTALCTTTEAMRSLEAKEATLTSPEVYACRVIEQQKGIFDPKKSFSFTIVEYCPLSKHLRQQIKGYIDPRWVQ